jgi:hypothetical protein
MNLHAFEHPRAASFGRQLPLAAAMVETSPPISIPARPTGSPLNSSENARRAAVSMQTRPPNFPSGLLFLLFNDMCLLSPSNGDCAAD